MGEPRRPDRVAEAIREEVATFLSEGAKDPRIRAFVEAYKAKFDGQVPDGLAAMGYDAMGVLADAMCPGHCRTDMGGENAPRSAEEGADTIVWLATREAEGAQTGHLWEDRLVVPW